MGRITAIVLSCLIIAGCGRTGPLYLPDDDADNQTARAAQPVAAHEETA